MGKFVNSDNSSFQRAFNSEIYVDKSGLLKYTNKVMSTLQGYICNSRPRRFGKSITANMLNAYYSKGCDSESLFSKLEIGKSPDFKKYLNKYDVIHLDIQWCVDAATGVDYVISFITKNTIAELREYYPNILNESINTLTEALSQINYVTGNKFVIIIDEWDYIIRNETVGAKLQQEYINFLRGLFKGIEPTKYIQLAYLTGILPIIKEKAQSALNNFTDYTMLNAGPLAQYIGFTEKEVIKLCKKYKKNFEEVRRWYDGYLLGTYHVYNPAAVISLLTFGVFQSYWSSTASYEAVVPLINMDFDGLKSAIIAMLAGEHVSIDVFSFNNDIKSFSKKEDVLTYLIHLGYLGYDSFYKTAFIPNEEIRQELIRATSEKKWNELITLQRDSEKLLNDTLDMNGDAVAKQLEKIHREYVSSIQYNNENSLSSVLAVAYLSAMQYYFKPIREMPMGRGFSDFVFVPKPEFRSYYPALVVELKWNKSVETALQQIKEKKYPDSLKSYTGNILLVGISYDEKTKEHSCVIAKEDK